MAKTINYVIKPSFPAAHLFDVELTVSDPDPNGQTFTLPAWVPGSYMIRDFARHIVSIRAISAGETVSLRKLDKQSWQAGPVSSELQLRYQVYARDLSVRASYLDNTRAYFNGSSVFLRVVGQESIGPVVEIANPDGEKFADWTVATSLPAVSVNERGFGRYKAESYAALIDHPVESGCFQQLAFNVQGIPHRMALSGCGPFDKARLERDLQTICTHHADFFGELPLSQYLFLTFVTGDGYGGLEHMDSTSLMCSRNDLPFPGMQEITDGYRRFLGLCSHEYFHLWNVKRIQPEVLSRADLSAEVYTEQLWAFEGITSYYDELALVRCGCIDTQSYLELVARNITRVMRGSGRFKQSIAESSFDAWTKFYKQEENAPNAIVSYYAKGALAAFGLDVLLQQKSGGQLSLDTLMTELWKRYGKTRLGVPENGIQQLAEELAGADLGEFFAAVVRGVDELPLEQWFEYMGIGYRLRPAKDQNDTGGTCDKPSEPADERRVLGATWVQQGDFVMLKQVMDHGAAQGAGLSAGDRIVAMDGLQVDAASLATRVERIGKGEKCVLTAFRRDELLTFDVTPKVAPSDTCELWVLPEQQCSAQQKQRRRRWLGKS